MTLETTHNGKTCKYNEDDNKWNCPEYDLTANSLSSLKTKINEFDAKERKLGNGVTLLKLDNYYRYGSKLGERVKATMLDKEFTDGNPHVAVWITHVESKQREKAGIHSLILDTEENQRILKEAAEVYKEGNLLLKKAEKMRADIPRVTVEQIKAMALEVKPQ